MSVSESQISQNPPLTNSPTSRLGVLVAQAGNLRDTLEILWRRRLLIVAVVSVVMALASVSVYRMTPQYTATAKVMLDSRTPRVVNLQDVVGGLRLNRVTFLGEVEVIRSRRLAMAVIEQLRLQDSSFFQDQQSHRVSLNPVNWMRKLYNRLFPAPVIELDPETEELREKERLINRFLGGLSVRLVSMSPVIEISYRTPDPALSAHIANTVAEVYVTSQLEAKFEATRKATIWLNDRLENLRLKVRDSEQAVADYRAEYGLIDGSGKTLTEEKMSSLNGKFILAQAQRAELEARYQQVKQMMEAEGGVEATDDVLSSPLVQRLLEQEALLNRKLAELSTRYGHRHPKMIDANSEMTDLKLKIRAEVGKIASALKSELAIVSSRVKTLNEALEKVNLQAATEGAANVRLSELEREAEANRLIYQTFLSRFKETSQQEDIQQADARIISEAARPGGPSAPRKRLILTVVLISAIAASVVLVFFVEVMDVGLKSADQVEHITGLPVLTMVPTIDAKKANQDIGRYVLEHPLSTASESVRNLYTSLRLARPDSPLKKIAVTSSVAGEGKTTLSLWLAQVAVDQGRKVIIIDCDLRRPKLHRAMELDNTNSIADVIAGSCTLEQSIQIDGRSKVHVIPGKEVHGNALEVIGSERYRQVIDELSSLYDMIIFDAPPVLAVSDVRVLSRIVDTTVFLVRWNSTDKMAVVSSLKQFRATGGKVLGMVVSQVDTRKHSRYGYGDYGYYYGRYTDYYHKS